VIAAASGPEAARISRAWATEALPTGKTAHPNAVNNTLASAARRFDFMIVPLSTNRRTGNHVSAQLIVNPLFFGQSAWVSFSIVARNTDSADL
jgi:hypothetical protein